MYLDGYPAGVLQCVLHQYPLYYGYIIAMSPQCATLYFWLGTRCVQYVMHVTRCDAVCIVAWEASAALSYCMGASVHSVFAREASVSQYHTALEANVRKNFYMGSQCDVVSTACVPGESHCAFLTSRTVPWK